MEGTYCTFLLLCCMFTEEITQVPETMAVLCILQLKNHPYGAAESIGGYPDLKRSPLFQPRFQECKNNTEICSNHHQHSITTMKGCSCSPYSSLHIYNLWSSASLTSHQAPLWYQSVPSLIGTINWGCGGVSSLVTWSYSEFPHRGGWGCDWVQCLQVFTNIT